MLPPGLSRAISDSTSPFGAYPAPDVLRTLEVYFADPRSTDAVYEGLLSRAYSEPISVPLVEKVISLLKVYLLRFTPSVELVALLEEFSFRVQELKELSPQGRSAVAYVRSCLRQLRGERPAGLRVLRGSYGSMAGGGSANSSLRGSIGRSREDLSHLAADGRFPGVKVSVSSSALGRENDRYAAADALPSPTDADAFAAGGGALPAWLRQSSAKGARGWEELGVPSPQQAAQGIEPAWAVPARPLQLPPPPPGATAGRALTWMQHLPDLAPRVILASALSGSLGGPSAAAAQSSQLPGASPISIATIHRCVLDLEEQDIGRHLAEVLGEARSEALQQQTPGQQPQRPRSTRAHPGAHGAGGGGGARHGPAGRRGRPGRLLFHHPPYNRSEQLPMTEADVAVVVEAVCGVRAASALAAVQGPPGAAGGEEEEEEAAAGQPEGMWQAAFEEDPDFAQMCGSILMKLIVDLWMRCGPIGSYTLVLRMLRACLSSAQPATRARAFDVLYNLAIHGAMLRSEAEEAALAAAAEAAAAGSAGVSSSVQLPWQVCNSAPLSPFSSGAGGLTPQRPPAPASTPAPAATPPLYPGGGGASKDKDPLRPLASHSLKLAGSSLLDSGANLSGMAAARTASRGGGGGGGGGGADVANGHAPKPPVPQPSPAQSGPQDIRGSQQQAALGGGGSGGGGGGGGSAGTPAGYERWLRALLFQLLCDLYQRPESADEVWRAAMGCTAQLCSHGGHWVAAWVQHLPPRGLGGLLQAAWYFNWSQELYAHLLRLVPYVLVRPGDAAAGAVSAAPPAMPQPSEASTPTGARRVDSAFAAPTAVLLATVAAGGDVATAAADEAAAADGDALAQRLEEFGGLDEILFHFARAPTPDSRASLLTALVYCCCGGGGGGGAGFDGAVSVAGSLSSSGERFPGAAGTGGSSGSRGTDSGGPAAVLALLQGLHLDSVCLVLRAALQRPWPGMSSRLADVLASAVLLPELGAGAFAGLTSSLPASASASADYGGASPAPAPPHTPPHTLPAGVASPIAARALLRPLLESLEERCSASMMLLQDDSLRVHMDVTLAHVGGGALGGPASPPPLTPERVEAAWEAFKDVCSQGSPEAPQEAIHWLHQLLSAACRAFQGQLLLLSPLSLRTSPEAVRLAAATPAGASGAAGTLPSWNSCLADALKYIVREARAGCELLMRAVSRVVADLKATAAAAAAAAAADAPASPQRRGTPGRALGAPQAAAAGAEEAALSACRRVMELYYVGLQWMLQCGSAEDRMPTVLQLADAVLTALLQSDPAAAAATASAPASDKAAQGGAGGAGGSARGSGFMPQPSGGRAGAGSGVSILSQLQPHLSGASAGASTGNATAAPPLAQQQEPGGGMLISQRLLSGLMAFDPDALACTPPELLVSLLQQCSQNVHKPAQHGTPGGADVAADGGAGAAATVSGDIAGGSGGYQSMQRGFIGRPCPVVGVDSPGVSPSSSAGGAAAAGGAGGGRGLGRASGTGDAAPSCAAVGPWQDGWQDRRLALLLLLMARCSLDPEAFAKYSLSHVIKAQLSCEDLRCRYYAGVYLLKHWMLNQHDKYWRTLRHIIGTAQQLNDERLLDNPYLQMRTMLNVDHV